jgi:hypothetical protein
MAIVPSVDLYSVTVRRIPRPVQPLIDVVCLRERERSVGSEAMQYGQDVELRGELQVFRVSEAPRSFGWAHHDRLAPCGRIIHIRDDQLIHVPFRRFKVLPVNHLQHSNSTLSDSSSSRVAVDLVLNDAM